MPSVTPGKLLGVADQKLEPETLEFIFEQVRDAPASQLRAVDALDSKMVQAFAAAGVIVGLAAAGADKRDALTGALVSVGVAAFVVVASAAAYSLWARRFRVVMAADQLWTRYWADPVEEIKLAIVDDVADAYAANAVMLAEKRKALRVALVALAVEAVAIGASVIASAFS